MKFADQWERFSDVDIHIEFCFVHSNWHFHMLTGTALVEGLEISKPDVAGSNSTRGESH